MQFPLGRLPWLPIPPTAGLALHYTSMPLESHNSITSCQYCYASCPPSPIDCLHAGIVPFIFFIFVSCTILDPQSLSQRFLHLQKLAKATWPTRDQTDLHQTFSLQHTPLSLMDVRVFLYHFMEKPAHTFFGQPNRLLCSLEATSVTQPQRRGTSP